MTSEPAALRSRVKSWRERAGLRPGDLARAAGLSRQALHAVETNASVPSAAVALRIARALDCTVEDLFVLGIGEESVRARLSAAAGNVPAGTRVHLAELGAPGDLIAVPLRGPDAWRFPADGVTRSASRDGRVEVTVWTPARDAARTFAHTLVVAGCDPSLGLLAAHASSAESAASDRVRLVWSESPSLAALRAVARGEAHAAGIHLWDAGLGESNRSFVEREVPGGATLFTLWTWEQGLIVAAGNPKGVASPADLARPGVRLANRAAGAGSRLLLDAWLDAAGLTGQDRAALPGYESGYASHLALAEAVRRGDADVGPGPRAAAALLGLDFVAVQRERFDLVVPREHLGHPGLRALLSAAKTPAVHADLAALGGYDPTHAAEVWLSTPPRESPPRETP